MATLSVMWRRGRRAALGLGLGLALSACGFHLRGSGGQYNLPFDKIYITLPETAPLAQALKRNIRAGGVTEVVAEEKQADGIIEVLNDPEKTRGKTILSLNSNGRVREYQLTYTVNFRVRDGKGNELLKPTQISLNRAMTFDDSQLLAKETEEAQLYRDMRTDMVQQLQRRVAAVKPVITSSPVPKAAPAAGAVPGAGG